MSSVPSSASSDNASPAESGSPVSLAFDRHFDATCPDITLRSSDGVGFPMRQADLIRASPVFEAMLSLPQPAAADGAVSRPVVALSEPAGCLRVLLPYCEVGPRPRVDTCDAAVRLLEGARKYEVAWAEADACAALARLARAHAVPVYCVACRFALRGLAGTAARACLRDGAAAIVGSRADELDWVTAHQLRRLLHYVETCGTAMERHFESGSWVLSAFPDARDRFWEMRDLCDCRTGRASCGSMLYDIPNLRVDRRPAKPAVWFETVVKKTVAKLRLCPSEEKVLLDDVVAIFLESQPCKRCCSAASKHLPRLIPLWRGEISALLSTVSLFLL